MGKKLILLHAMLFCIMFLQAQNRNNAVNNVAIGVGVLSSNGNYYKVGCISLDLTIYNLHFNVNSNFGKGNGKRNKYVTENYYLSDNRFILILNFGYSIQIKEYLIFTPYIGAWNGVEIYQDPIAQIAYYYGNSIWTYNYGASIAVKFTNNMGIYVATGRKEIYRLGYIIYF